MPRFNPFLAKADALDYLATPSYTKKILKYYNSNILSVYLQGISNAGQCLVVESSL